MGAAKFSPDGQQLAAASYDRLVRLWDVAKLLGPETGSAPRAWRGHDCILVGLAFSRDGKRLVSGSRDGTVRVWDMTRWDNVTDR